MCFSLEIKDIYKLAEFHVGGIEAKKILYRTDVISTFYLSKNETAILPTNTAIKITINHDFWEIENNPELQKQIYSKEENHYLIYLEKEYGVNADPGFTFLPTEEAMKLFYEKGGILNEQDVEALDFDKIKTDLDNSI